jgi:hypothetical protein
MKAAPQRNDRSRKGNVLPTKLQLIAELRGCLREVLLITASPFKADDPGYLGAVARASRVCERAETMLGRRRYADLGLDRTHAL